MKENKLYLQDLPKNITYILLKENFKKQFFKTFLKYFNNQPAQAEKWLKTKRANIRYWKSKGGSFVYKNKRKFSCAYIPLWAILKISKFLINKRYKNYSIRNIEKNLIAYRHKRGSSIFNPKFPINLETKEAAIVCAAILCDGGINKNGYPMYNNSEDCMRIKVVNAINKLIGNIHTNALKPYKNNSIVFPKILKSILVKGMNMQIGDKVINNPKIPKILLNTNKKDVISAFLNQAFSDDGSAYISGKHKQGTLTFGQSIDISNLNKKLIKKIKKERLTNYASNVVNGCKIMLEKLEIKVNGPYPKLPYIRNKGGKKRMVMSWVIQIQGRKNIQIYKDLIGFSIPRKNKKINEILKNYKYVDYRKSFEISHNIIKILNKDKIVIQLDNFVKKRGCTRDYARQLLKNLRKEGIIERSGGGINKGIWGCTPYEYKLINK